MSLLYKPLESITDDDLQSLIDNQVRESLYIEYKTEVFEKRDEKKRLQFLGSVSGFANSAGGDILVGVKADNGLPLELTGLDPTDVDSEILRIRQVVGTGIEPYLALHFWAVPLPTGRVVLVIRIQQSWSAPHGIEQDSHFKFFRRHAAGRSPMTLSELRSAFTFSAGVVEQIKAFRAERLSSIRSEAHWGYFSSPLAVLHIVPFSGAAGTVNIDFSNSPNLRRLSPLPAAQDGCITQGALRYNLDGAAMREDAKWHTQIFRNGAIEYATAKFFEQTMEPYYLDAWMYQVNILNVLRRFFGLQRQLGVAPPVIVMLTILNAINFRLRVSEGSAIHSGAVSKYWIDRDPVSLPDLVFNDFDADSIATLKPAFDCLWNAVGQPKCNFYKPDGGWNLDQSWLDPPTIF
jgi:hypothetical protein